MKQPDQDPENLEGPRAGMVDCLGRCGKQFHSPDRLLIRICRNCKISISRSNTEWSIWDGPAPFETE